MNYMNIIGIVAIFALPYMAGYILKSVLNVRNNKETSQIETYLTGFFFVFLLQGIVFNVGYKVLHLGFDEICTLFAVMSGVILGLAIMLGIINRVVDMGKDKEPVYRAKMKDEEIIYLTIMLVIAAMVISRLFFVKDYLRTDIMLPSIRTTIATRTIYEVNPITSRPYELGLIGSKKIIALPIYYAYLCTFYGFDESTLLYIILPLQTILCTYLVSIQFIAPIFKNRAKTLIFGIFLGAMMLSGDYYKGAVGTRLLWMGYDGGAIVATVMLPYVLFLFTDMYRRKRDGEEDISAKMIIVMIAKIIVCLAASVLITSISTGVLLVAVEIIVMSISCLIRYRLEVANHE